MIDDILSIIEQGELLTNLKIFEVTLDQLLIDVLVVCVDDPTWDHIFGQKLLTI